jgi:DNA polymerase-3 subunit chi
MAEILFYHLERSTLDEVLPGLLQKTLERGQRALVRCGSPEALEALDERLWTYADQSFLPHAPTGGARDADQPVLLTLGEEASNGAAVLFLVADAEASSDLMARFERAVRLFGSAEVEEARAAWKAVKDAGLEATYWKQSPQGRWERAG